MTHRQTLAILLAAALCLAAPALARAAGDPGKGGALFNQRCGFCHPSTPGAGPGVGPNLFGVTTRKAGTLANYNYSAALKASGLSWTAVELNSFLTAPSRKVVGTKMMVSVSSAQDRADIIAYLSNLRN